MPAGSTAEEWLEFFQAAGISESAETYAVSFANNNMKLDMLSELNKNYLFEMGIARIGDVIAILRHAKSVHESSITKSALMRKVDSSGIRSTITKTSDEMKRRPPALPSETPPKKNRISISPIRLAGSNKVDQSSEVGSSVRTHDCRKQEEECPTSSKRSVFNRLGTKSKVGVALLNAVEAGDPGKQVGWDPKMAKKEAVVAPSPKPFPPTRGVAPHPLAVLSSKRVTASSTMDASPPKRVVTPPSRIQPFTRPTLIPPRVSSSTSPPLQGPSLSQGILKNRISSQPNGKYNSVSPGGVGKSRTMRADQPDVPVHERTKLPTFTIFNSGVGAERKTSVKERLGVSSGTQPPVTKVQVARGVAESEGRKKVSFGPVTQKLIPMKEVSSRDRWGGFSGAAERGEGGSHLLGSVSLATGVFSRLGQVSNRAGMTSTRSFEKIL